MKARCMRKMEMEEGGERWRGTEFNGGKNVEKGEEMRGKESKDVEK